MTVYIGARDLNGLPVGTHQFIVITFPTPQTIIIGRRAASSRTLGPNVHGIVIGAQNRGSLKVEAFEDADILAAREYFGGVEKNGMNLTMMQNYISLNLMEQHFPHRERKN